MSALEPGAIAVALTANLIAAAAGLRWPDPLAWLPRLVRAMDRRLNRENRSRRDLRMRGTVVLAMLVGAGVAAGLALDWLAVGLPAGTLAALLLAFLASTPRRLASTRTIADCLARSDLAAAREVATRMLQRPLGAADAHTVARGAAGGLVRGFADGAVAPALWLAVGGAPGMLAAAAVLAADARLGSGSTRHADFGAAVRWAALAVRLLPERVAGLLLAVASVAVPAASPGAAFGTMLRAPFGEWPEGAGAGALGLALLGPPFASDWIGKGRARVTPDDLRRCRALVLVASALLAVVFAAVAALLYRE